MRNTLPQMIYVQETLVSLAGQVRIGIESSNASITGDDKFHANTGNTLEMPPLDSYGAHSRWFDVFSAGVESCEWEAAPAEPWVILSQYNGTVGPETNDTRVYISVDWENAPEAPNSTVVAIDVTTPCRKYERYAYDEPQILLPVNVRTLPGNFTEGFVESDQTVSIEGPHYQSIAEPENGGDGDTNITYHTLKNYGRTLGGVGLHPMDLEKLPVNEAPALQYEMYLFSNFTMANVTLFLSPSHNFLSDLDPLEYAIALYPANDSTPADPEIVKFVGPSGTNMPAAWDNAVADSVWGVTSNTTTTSFNVSAEGAYTLKIWCLLPSIIVQKIVIDLGGVRESYLGPPESFLVGRDEVGEYNMTSFLDTPGTVGAGMSEQGGSQAEGSAAVDEDDAASVMSRAGNWGFALVVAVGVALMM